MQEVHDVAVMHDIGLAFGAQLAGRPGFTAQRDDNVIGDGFGANEALLEIAVDFARGLWRSRAGMTVQCRALWPLVKKVSRWRSSYPADHAREAGFVQPHFLEEHHAFFVVHAEFALIAAETITACALLPWRARRRLRCAHCRCGVRFFDIAT